MNAVYALSESLITELQPPSASDRCWTRVTDQSLLARLRTGQSTAFQELVRVHSPRMTAVAMRMLRSEHDAADAVQEAFISAFQSIDRFDGQALLSTWLHAIVVNMCLMQMRKKRRRPACSLNALDAERARFSRPRGRRSPESTSPDDLHCESETAEQAMRLVERLPSTYRDVVVTRIIEGNDTLTSSRLLRTSESVVKTRLHRARRLLRGMLANS
jgi:RNA polymerase sigma-70 factor, ECF subfamily